MAKADKVTEEVTDKVMEEVRTFNELHQKASRLSKLALQYRLAAQPEERVLFLQSLEDGRVQARAELDAMARIVTGRLGVPQEEWLHIFNEELANQVEILQVELGVDGWDKNGNPVVAQRKKS